MGKERESLCIEILVDLSPGSLIVQSYSDTNTDTLGKAINEAQQFIHACRRMKRHIDRYGLGKRPPSQGIKDAGRKAGEVLDAVFARSEGELSLSGQVFASKALFRHLTRGTRQEG
jgi:hypothetical protein